MSRAADRPRGGRLWFNPLVRGLGGGAAVAVAGDRRGRRMRRRRTDRAAADAPHFVADGGGIDHRYEGDFQYFVGGGVAAFDCDDDGRSELFFAGGSAPAALYRNESPIGGALRLHAAAVAGHRPDGGHRRLPARHRQRRPRRPRRAARRRGRGPARARRTAGSSGPTRRSASTAATRGPSPSARRGRASNALPDAGVRRLPRAGSPVVRGQPAAAAGGGRRPVRRRRSRSTPGLLHAVDAVQRLEPVRPARPAHDERPALLPRRAATSCGASRPARRRGPYTEADGWRPLQIWGMGIASEDVTGDGYPEVFLTSQGDNKLQTLADGPAGRRTRTSRSTRGATAHRPFTGGDVLPSTAWHDRVRRRQQRRLRRPVRRQGQRRGRGGVRHPRSRATC